MQTTTSIQKSGSPWYVHRWPWLLMAGPVLVILAGIYTTYLAFVREDALVVDDYYKEGKAINQDLRRDRVATRLDMSLDLRYDARSGALRGTLLSGGKPASGKIVIHLTHPTLPEKDLLLKTDLAADGSFSAALPMLARERWQVLVEDEGREWRLMKVWMWPDQKAVTIHADVSGAG